MPSWFSKLFDSADKPSNQEARPELPTGSDYLAMVLDEESETPPPRRIIQGTVCEDETDVVSDDQSIRIKAAVLSPQSCRFMVDRPLLEGGYSLIILGPDTMHHSPLAETVFELGGIEAMVIHGMNVTVTRSPREQSDWKPLAIAVGARIRAHIKAENPAMAEAYRAEIPPEATIRERLEEVLEEVINPGIAAHSGYIRLDRVEGNTAFIEMQGGCQGCAASQMTLRNGVEQLFRQAVPQLGLILDVTDHEAGTNPFYASLPTDEG